MPTTESPSPAPAGPNPRGTTARHRALALGGAALAIALVAGLLGGLLVHWTTDRRTTAAGPVECDAVALAGSVLPTVVTIKVTAAAGQSNGTGEVVRADGHILTNDHVISSAARGGSITALFSDGSSLPATIVGRVPTLDLAVLKVTPSGRLPVIGIGQGSVRVGQPVVALGSPLGLYGSLTRGIVSALGRDVRVPAESGTALLAGAIQTDAAINPGNSGGPLVDCAGRMVGVNTAIATVPNASGDAGGGSVGIGFAIPVDLASSVAGEVIATGRFVMPTFGVNVAPVGPADAETSGQPSGLFVRQVVRGGPADVAGIAEGDVLTRVDGTTADGPDVLTKVALAHRPGDRVEVERVRDTKTSTVTVTLGGDTAG